MKVTDEWLYEKMPIVDAWYGNWKCARKKITFFQINSESV